eukprot:3267111-Pyramimonas_sp.AAC.1
MRNSFEFLIAVGSLDSAEPWNVVLLSGRFSRGGTLRPWKPLAAGCSPRRPRSTRRWRTTGA